MKINKTILRKSDITDFNRLSESELLKVVRQVAKIVNPMVNKLARAGAEQGKIASDAYDRIMREGGLINTVGTSTLTKTRNELLKELNRGLYFIHRKTATVRGARAVKRQREEIINEDFNTEGLTQDEIDKLISEEWDKFHKFLESHQNIPYSKAVEIYNTSNKTPEIIGEKLHEYQVQQEQEQQNIWQEVSERTGFSPKWQL